jgi:hypothetical protein
MSTVPKYGSVEQGDVDRSFDVAETYYLKDGSTPEQRRKKFVRILVPLLAAFLIVGGAAYLLIRSFGHLYPGSGGDSREYNYNGEHHGNPVPEPAPKPAPSSGGRVPAPLTPHIHTSGSEADAACSSHEKCAEKNLGSDCCPTTSGVFLDCCN